MRIASWVVAAVVAVSAGHAPGQVTIEPHEDRYTVKIDGQLFTEYIFKGYDKPILYPIIGPYGISMTRNWPMKEGVPGEATDHPHHKSMWFTHGKVNGVDFWAEGPGKGKLQTFGYGKTEWQSSSSGPLLGGVHSRIHWNTPTGESVCDEERKIEFSAIGDSRVMDVAVRLYVPSGKPDAILGDTKEGTMAIRTRPELEIKHGAKAVNSEGVTGVEIWGKRAKWVDYSGVVDGKTVGVAIFDHPSNPRHPTWWHARDYGLIAANPFGIHDFEKKPPGAGDMKIPAGQSVTFRYRFVFHEGDAEAAGIGKMYEEYAAEKPSKVERPTSNVKAKSD